MAVIDRYRASGLAARLSYRHLGYALLAIGAGMVPWLVVLAVTLPGATHVPHWSTAWTGLDGLEAIGLATTGWLTLRRDPRRCLTAMATAALLLADAWFDITTSGTGGPLAEALIMAACAEIPAATVLSVLAYRGVISNQTQVPESSRTKPQRSAISLTSWKPRPLSSFPLASRQWGRPTWPSSMTSTCTYCPSSPWRTTTTVTAAASAACRTALVTSSQVSSSASIEAGWPSSAFLTKRRASGTSSARRANDRVSAIEPKWIALGARCLPIAVIGAPGISASAFVTTVRIYTVAQRRRNVTPLY
jgi:hypothetical protein